MVVLQGWSSLVKLGQVPSLTWLCPLDNDDAEVHSHFLVGSAYSRCVGGKAGRTP